jgi:two-component system response regulator GlrR
MGKILLVDDDPDILKLIALRLSAAGHAVRTADSGEQALALFAAERPELVLTDLKMGGMDGLALFDALRRQAPSMPVIVLTAHGTIPDAVDATRRGVFGFLTKPFEPKELLAQVDAALRQAVPVDSGLEGMVAVAPAMCAVLDKVRLVAPSDASVFITGASGSGKEVLARVIHRLSQRAAAPFVAINCAAIPEHLLESELFGHRKGAFTGAAYDHRGLIQEADGGTLFLDEIGDMPLALQAKLLRVLQERQVRPVGASKDIPVDVRLISATHRDLAARIREQAFREDLYYRIKVVALDLPPLAARPEDIPALTARFLADTATRYCKRVTAFAPEAMALLLAAPWPGNVRQLQNVVEQTVALATTPVVPVTLVQEALQGEGAQGTDWAGLDEARRQFEHDYLVRLLRITEGSVSRAAALAERNRTEFYKLLERHHLDPKAFRGADEGLSGNDDSDEAR